MAGLLDIAPSTRDAQALSLLDLLRINPRGYGLGPAHDAPGPMPEWRAGPSRAEAVIDAINTSLPRRILHDIVMQPVTAGKALGEAINDPTIPNMTNAGAQTAFALLRPTAALKVLGAGYGAAAAKDLGLFDPSKVEPGLLGGLVSSADARGRKKEPDKPAFSARPGLTPEQNDELAKAIAKAADGDFGSGAERRATEATIKRLEDLSAESIKAKNANEAEAERKKASAAQEEYNRATQRAEAAKAKEVARDWRFSDTEFGKTFQKTGGAAAAGAAFAGGLLNRLGHQALSGGAKQGFGSGVVAPAVEGTGLAFTMNNLPLANDAFLTSADNPQKAGLLAYARELPESDPRRVRAEQDAAKLPDKNPVREEASREFWDQFGSRLGTSAVEGIPSALTGNIFVPAMKGAASMLARTPGRMREDYYGAMTGAERARAEMLSARNAAEGAANDVAMTRASRAPTPLREEKGLLPAPTRSAEAIDVTPVERLSAGGDVGLSKMIADMRRAGATDAQIEDVVKSLRRGLLP